MDERDLSEERPGEGRACAQAADEPKTSRAAAEPAPATPSRACRSGDTGGGAHRAAAPAPRRHDHAHRAALPCHSHARIMCRHRRNGGGWLRERAGRRRHGRVAHRPRRCGRVSHGRVDRVDVGHHARGGAPGSQARRGGPEHKGARHSCGLAWRRGCRRHGDRRLRAGLLQARRVLGRQHVRLGCLHGGRRGRLDHGQRDERGRLHRHDRAVPTTWPTSSTCSASRWRR